MNRHCARHHRAGDSSDVQLGQRVALMEIVEAQ
jgi:hypothetical protein